MRRLLGLLVWLGIFALQLSLWPQLTVRVLPAFAFAAALAWGATAHPRAGLWAAVGSGLVLDLYAQHDFGRLTVASAAGYGTFWLVLRGYTAGAVSWAPVLAGGAAAVAVYELALLLWTALSVEGFPFLAETFRTGTLNAIATFVAFLISVGLAGLYADRTTSSRHEGSLRYR
ncbi:MAG: hypothetical protein M3N59_03220 [bacterium]|nr:hypothetical protein [bacterium]